jgi:hypothetical protein
MMHIFLLDFVETRTLGMNKFRKLGKISRQISRSSVLICHLKQQAVSMRKYFSRWKIKYFNSKCLGETKIFYFLIELSKL